MWDEWKKILKNGQTLQSIICKRLQDSRKLKTPHFPVWQADTSAMFFSLWIDYGASRRFWKWADQNNPSISTIQRSTERTWKKSQIDRLCTRAFLPLADARHKVYAPLKPQTFHSRNIDHKWIKCSLRKTPVRARVVLKGTEKLIKIYGLTISRERKEKVFNPTEQNFQAQRMMTLLHQLKKLGIFPASFLVPYSRPYCIHRTKQYPLLFLYLQSQSSHETRPSTSSS